MKEQKDILFEKHREILMENCEFVNGQVQGLIVHGAIEKAANTTKEIAKGFAEWVAANEYRGIYFSFGGYAKWNFPYGEGSFTTEQLLEKYLLTLNQ